MVVGRIQGPYGIKGWVHIAAFTEPRENLLNYQPWQLAPAGFSADSAAAGKPSRAWQPVEIRQIRPHKQGFVALLVGVEDRNAAEALKGRLIGVAAEKLTAPEPNEYYWRDLIGTRVRNSDGELLGLVTGLLETGAHDVLVIQPAAEDETTAEELLIPFHPTYVVEVDLARKLIQVDWESPEAD